MTAAGRLKLTPSAAANTIPLAMEDRMEATGSGRTCGSTPLVSLPLGWSDRQRRRWAVWLLLLTTLLYFAAVTIHWRIGEDAGLYLNLGRNLARGEGYSLAGKPHAFVPPGYPAFLSALMLAGAKGFLAINLAMCLCGLATVAFSYLMLRDVVGRDYAILLAAVTALANEMHLRSGEVLTDVPFTLLVVAALWLYYRGLRADRPDRRGWEVASLLLVAGCWVRLVGFVLAFGAAAGLLLSAGREGRRRALLAAIIVLAGMAATLAVFYSWHAAYHDPMAPTYARSLDRLATGTSLLERMVRPIRNVYITSGQLSRLYIGQRMPLPVCVILLVAPVLVAMAVRIRRGDRLGPLVVFCYVGGLSAVTWLRTRYLLPLLPLLILYLLEGYGWILSRLFAKRLRGAVTALVVLMVVMVGFNLPQIARRIYYRHRPDYPSAQQKEMWRDSLKAVDFLRGQKPIRGTLFAEQPVGYLADVPCPKISHILLQTAPPPEEISRLLRDWQTRYVVIDLGDERLPFQLALMDYMESLHAERKVFGEVRVYRVPQARDQTVGPASRPATAS